MTIAGGNIDFKQLGKSFTPLHISSWEKYLQKEKVEFYKRFRSKPPKASKKDFMFIKQVGSGTFGKVILSKHLYTEIYHAAKIIVRKNIQSAGIEEQILREHKILLAIKFPFAANLDYYIDDEIQCYIIMPMVIGGELFSYLEERGKFTENVAKFYTSQVVLVLEYLHYMDVIYRDLKPENILIDHYGYIKIVDFGFSKTTLRTYTICGTPAYLAPEILLNQGYGSAVDWWALGVLIFELLSGDAPFTSSNLGKTYKNITECNYNFPKHFSNHARNLIKNLLQLDITKRYGNLRAGANDIKNHEWFSNIQWLKILERTVPSPYKPLLRDITDTSNFFDIKHKDPIR